MLRWIVVAVFIVLMAVYWGLLYSSRNPSDCELCLRRYSENITNAKSRGNIRISMMKDILQKGNDCVAKFVRKFALHEPSDIAYNFMSPGQMFFSQFEQDLFVDGLLGSKRNGFFVECGAGDGEFLSNSLFFERERGWTGLLIEADPISFARLKSKHRKSTSLNACLSTSGSVMQAKYQEAGLNGGITRAFDPPFAAYLKGIGRWKPPISITCYPLHILLQAVNRIHIDYFSLDIEGGEISVLKSIPWNKITIDVLTVEFRTLKRAKNKNQTTIDEEETKAKFKQTKAIVLGTGLYEVAGTLPAEDPPNLALDIVFKRKHIR